MSGTPPPPADPGPDGRWADDCPVCERARGDAEPPGGWILREGAWAVGVFPGFEIPGWLFVELHTRHAEGPWSLEDEEAESLGAVLTRTSAAIRAETGAEKVYWLAYGELFPHFHVLLCPRAPDASSARRGPALFTGREDLLDPPGALDTAQRLQAALGG